MKMEILGNIYISLGIFFFGLILFSALLKLARPEKRKLGQIDLVWQSTLIIGVIFATAEIRKQMNTWQYESNLSYTTHWFDETVNDLQRYHFDCEKEYKWLLKIDSLEALEYLKASSWYKDKAEKLLKSRESIITKNDTVLWNELYGSLYKFTGTDLVLITQFYEFVKLDADNINEGLSELVVNKKKKESNYLEKLLYLFYPWILAFALTLRMSKTVYLTYFQERQPTTKPKLD